MEILIHFVSLAILLRWQFNKQANIKVSTGGLSGLYFFIIAVGGMFLRILISLFLLQSTGAIYRGLPYAPIILQGLFYVIVILLFFLLFKFLIQKIGEKGNVDIEKAKIVAKNVTLWYLGIIILICGINLGTALMLVK